MRRGEIRKRLEKNRGIAKNSFAYVKVNKVIQSVNAHLKRKVIKL